MSRGCDLEVKTRWFGQGVKSEYCIAVARLLCFVAERVFFAKYLNASSNAGSNPRRLPVFPELEQCMLLMIFFRVSLAERKCHVVDDFDDIG